MATTDFKYADTTDLRKFVPMVGGQLTSDKMPLRNWQTTSTSNLYKAFSSGIVDQLYINGIEGTKVTDQPNANEEYRYLGDSDVTEYYNTEHDPNDILMEHGTDYATYVVDMLESASQELNNYLDKRFPIPIPKQFFYDETTPSYDEIIKKITCYIAGVNILRADNPISEEADKLQEMADTLIERINAGDIKLRCEIDASDKNGEIIENASNGGTMHIVETYCEQWSGKLYDKISITATTAGAYGVGKFKVSMYGNNKIQGTDVLTEEVIQGSLQHVGNGMYVRFEGSEINVDDKFEIAIKRNDLDETNAQVKDIPIHRGRKEVLR